MTEDELFKIEPTDEQIRAGVRIDLEGRRVAHAVWYPQMGGYVGKAWVLYWPGDSAPCFTVFVWHDGDFPFGAGDDQGRRPAVLHHCEADQFLRFGERVARWQAEDAPLLSPDATSVPSPKEESK